MVSDGTHQHHYGILMVMSNTTNPLINQKTGLPIVGNVRKKVIEKNYDWGLYVYKKANGRWFTDGNGNVLNIESMVMQEMEKQYLFLG